MKQMIKELIIQKKYIFFTGILSILLMLPQLVLAYDLKHFAVMMFTLFLLFLFSIVNKILFFILGIYLSIVNIIIMHVALHWGYAYADLAPRFTVVMESPRSETVGYLTTFLDYQDAINIAYAFFIFYLLYRFISKYPNKLQKIKISSFILLIVMVATSFPYIEQREPYNIIPKLISISKGNTYVTQRKAFLKSHMNHTIKSIPLQYDKIIFILGESVNKHHMGIYGYKVGTTPFFSEMKKKNELYIFNTISPSNLTRISVPIYMTQARVNYFYNVFIHSSSFIIDYGLSGYKTVWLSAQGRVGHRNNLIAACADDANQSVFINNFYNTWAKRDIEIVNYLKKNIVSSPKQMYLLHLTGSHAKYRNRYEKNIAFYHHPKNIIEEYDNTIYYTDYVIGKIFETLVKQDKKVLVIYVSDHGEIVELSKNGHGFSSPHKDEYDVPFVIYSTIHNERLDYLKEQNKKHYFNLENMYSMVQYISGASDELNLSRGSKVIAVDPKYIFDYDKLDYFDSKE